LRSPGLLRRHYAPRTPLDVVESDLGPAIDALRHARLRIGVLTFGGLELASAPGLQIRNMPTAAEEYAAQLYAVLPELDAAGLDRIIVCLPPDRPEWLAVRDRLRRAAAV